MAPIGELIVRALSRHAGRVAFRAGPHGERAVHYDECAHSIACALGLFDALDLKPGDTVAQFAENTPEQWCATAACYLAGLRSVSLHATLTSENGQAALLDSADAKVFIGERSFDERLPAYRARAKRVAHWFSHEAGGTLPSFWQAAAAFGGTPLRNRAAPEDIVRLGLTRGTMGPRKGVLLSARALAATAMIQLADGGWPTEPTVLCAEPIGGGFGNMVLPTLLLGGTMVLQQGFEPTRYVNAVQRHRPSVAMMLPGVLLKLLDAPEAAAADWSSLQLLVYSGGSLSTERIAQAHRLLGQVLCQVHGQTECPKAFSLLRPHEHASPDESVCLSLGMPCTGMQAAILHDDLSPCAPHVVGELCVRGPAVASGYWRQPELTAHALRGGWWHSGDRCFVDARGYLHFVERMAAPAFIDSPAGHDVFAE
jgi:fatty-acyl-CoA synthase